MPLKDLDTDEPKYVTIKRSTFYALITIIILLILIMSGGTFIGYSIATSPKAMCSFVVSHQIGDIDAQDGCYYKLAKEYNEIEYCNNIKNKDLQKECARVLSGLI